MRKPVLGLIGFSDGEPEVHQQLKEIVQEQVDVIEAELKKSGEVDVITAKELVCSVESAMREAERLKALGVDGTIFSYGVFAYPNFSAIAAKNGKAPFLLAANLNPEWPGMVTMLAAGGALHHLGMEHFRAAGDFKNQETLQKLIIFGRCAKVVSSLNGQKYGLLGGRSLGMYSSTVSMQDWQKKFGIDVDHMDQSEIVRKAGEVSGEQVEKAFCWLKKHVGEIKFDGDKLTEEKLKEQIRHYEATKAIVEENHYDFIGVKCHYEMSRHYCTECLSAAFMNDPYDWDGEKEPVVFACEADSDAALTMQILKLLTGEPVIFMDVRHYDAENDLMVFCNCGSQSTYYATGTDDYKVNLKKTTLYPCLDIYAGGGCHVNLQTREGHATIARLNRYENNYRMTIIPADFVEMPKEKEAETTKEWPHVFARLPFDHQIFLDKFDANHCHAVYGDHVEELKMICRMLDIEVEILGEREVEGYAENPK
ncbi:MAG: L-fucose/L-arabinose isomerase family protein [Muricomes sp.]|uniref:L-fucose/L-arabinose isomerase family protein n=1 Tax=Faecalicatena contorta TaxID=39482 RepID=UPI002EAA63B9|nr:L-fucose/L-arabinose isomerase family protein [Muricomes sp.]